jgi:hypothetical protein
VALAVAAAPPGSRPDAVTVKSPIASAGRPTSIANAPLASALTAVLSPTGPVISTATEPSAAHPLPVMTTVAGAS